MTTLWRLTSGIKICLLELGRLPGASSQHIRSQIHLKLLFHRGKVFSLGHSVGLECALLNELSLLEHVDYLLVVIVEIDIITELLKNTLIPINNVLDHSLYVLLALATKLDPLV